MFFPADWDSNERNEAAKKELTPRARLLQSAETSYYVKLAPLNTLSDDNPGQSQWMGEYTKLLAFNLTEFDRVLVISPDSTVFRNLDELFLFPRAPAGM